VVGEVVGAGVGNLLGQGVTAGVGYAQGLSPGRVRAGISQ
jgi:hypothetical protein